MYYKILGCKCNFIFVSYRLKVVYTVYSSDHQDPKLGTLNFCK